VTDLLRVVGRDAGPHEPERRRQSVEQIDLEARGQKLVGRVESRGAGADDHGTHGALAAEDAHVLCLRS
jgi:hypothetical protein